MPDPLFIAILSRKAVLEPEHPRPRQYEPQAEWTSLGEWKAMSSSFSRPSKGLKRITLSLWYEEPAAAGEAASELAQRFKTFTPAKPRSVVFLQELCAGNWKTVVLQSPRGAVLSISCQLKSEPSSEGLGTMMWNILIDGTLAFLVS